jgi:hypothetical protein
MGLLRESILVQLFSKPQQTLAASTRREPEEKARLLISFILSIRQPAVIRKRAFQSLLPMVSLKMKPAIRAVVTISKLPKREALAALVFVNPSINNMGAAISRNIIPRI